MDREKIMERWDAWRRYIADGGEATWPRDAFESLLDFFEEAFEDIINLADGCDGWNSVEILESRIKDMAGVAEKALTLK